MNNPPSWWWYVVDIDAYNAYNLIYIKGWGWVKEQFLKNILLEMKIWKKIEKENAFFDS